MKLLQIARSMACAVALLSLSATAATKSFTLQVNDVSGLDSPWPMTGGLPFPEGEVPDPARIRIVNGEGEEVPSQIDVTATWRDGSVRWALAGIHASPKGEYRVEYGPGVSKSAPAHALTMKQTGDGGFTVDTVAAVYEFRADRLLPESGRMGATVFLAGSGDGAYLIDNNGRLARVAGDSADIETKILKQGPVRTVIRRAGWYVTPGGERVARAKAWFYFTAGSPFVRITHSIVFTEDTNKLWLRDYGLEFRTPKPAKQAVFALSEATKEDRYTKTKAPVEEKERRKLAEMFSSGLVERKQSLFPAALEGGEVYMLQDDYPHVLEREFRAVVARAPRPLIADGGTVDTNNLWIHPWLKKLDVAGDWAEARYDDHALAVVMPQLAQRFPKEIAVGPTGVRVAFWSGRSGRELDFRAVTLVNEYWKKWANYATAPFELKKSERGPAVAARVAKEPSNAQGAARTHDVWLLPRTGVVSDSQLKKQALAAANPPLLQADPAWMGNSQAIGWPMHPKDTEQFPKAEEAISNQWEEILGGSYGNSELRRTGFLMWGMHITIGHGTRWFRLATAVSQYELDIHAWLLFARSGERRYYDFARHYTRFAGDLGVHHWTAGKRFRGGLSWPMEIGVGLPMYWQGRSNLSGTWAPAWLLDYRLTGDEYANELLLMSADAYREHAALENPLFDYMNGRHVISLSALYEHTGDEKILTLLRIAAERMIDLKNPTGLNDNLNNGVYYKTSPEWLLPLHMYYHATGDKTARSVILRAMDYKFRFFYSSSQTFRLFLFTEAYRWTGNRAYLRLIKLMVEEPFQGMIGMNYFLGAPNSLHAIANAEQPIKPFPVLAVTRLKDRNGKDDSVARSDFTGHIMPHKFIEGDRLPPLLVKKKANTPMNLSIYVRTGNKLDEDAEPVVRVVKDEASGDGLVVDNVKIDKKQRYKTRNPNSLTNGRNYPRRWHVQLTLPAAAEAGRYRIEFPIAETVIVLESDAENVSLEGEIK